MYKRQAYGDKGLDRFDIAKEEATHFRATAKDPQALPTDAIDALAIDKKGNVWLTATHAQLIRLDADKKTFSTYSRADAGLPDFTVSQWRLLSNGNLLAQHSTATQGLYFFNPALGRGVTWAGAQGGSAVFEDRDGRVWTATSDGTVNVTSLNAGVVNRQLVPVYLRAVRQNGLAVDLGRSPELTREVRLASADKSFEFEFSALTYQNAQRNRYAYRLVGFETEWQDAQNNQTGRYTNLPPGEYELQVKAANSVGLWSDPALVLKVTLLPAWWQTLWFYGLIVLAAALVLLALYALTVGRLRRKMDALQVLVDARTTELREQRQKADEAALSKSYFLSNISHETRTPMNAIMGFANLMSRTKLDIRQRDYVAKISLSGRNLLGILNNIIDFSKTELGKLTVERTPFVLNVIVQNVIDIAAEKAREKDIEVICRISPDVPFQLVGDPLRLGQVLSNYLDNAVKFTERGEISVSVTMAKDEQASWTSGDVLLRFEVRDTGIGLSEDQRHQLFQSFSQLDQTATRKYGGTGMGLVVCKTLAALMGGDVGVQSTPGKGSMFWFTARLGWGSEQSAVPATAIDTRNYRVLVVDDNKTAAQVLTETIAEMGFPVESCHSGQAALQALGQASREGKGFDLLLLDWQMPVMDGLQTAKRIAALNLPKPPHTIMVTAYSRDDVIDEARACGINEVLRKPVNPSTLMATMVEVLTGGDFPQGELIAQEDAESYAIPQEVLALGGARILLVEDNPLNQEVACELLREAGFTVDVADNGMIGLEKLQAMSYDLVFMDMQMPVMDGVAATHEIRRNPAYASLPVVAMTASAMQADRERCIEAGMNDYVVKPIDPDELWTALLRWLKPAGQRQG